MGTRCLDRLADLFWGWKGLKVGCSLTYWGFDPHPVSQQKWMMKHFKHLDNRCKQRQLFFGFTVPWQSHTAACQSRCRGRRHRESRHEERQPRSWNTFTVFTVILWKSLTCLLVLSCFNLFYALNKLGATKAWPRGLQRPSVEPSQSKARREIEESDQMKSKAFAFFFLRFICSFYSQFQTYDGWHVNMS